MVTPRRCSVKTLQRNGSGPERSFQILYQLERLLQDFRSSWPSSLRNSICRIFSTDRLRLICRYNEGVRHAQTEHKETTPLLESATRGLIHTAERPGPGGGFDWEVDELIEWTNGLDFEE